MTDLQEKSNELVDVQSLVCSKCKKVFGYLSRAAYLQHVKGCGHRKFPCDICGHHFLTTATLRQHLKKHVDQVTCEICQRSFTSKVKLKTHKKSHVDISQRIEDRVKCNLCDKTFQWKSSLNRHKVTHGLRGPYSCECGKAFNSYSQFYKHTSYCSSHLMALAKKQQRTADADSEKVEHVKVLVIDKETVTNSVSLTCQLCSANFSNREHFEQHVQNCAILFPAKNPGRQEVLKLNYGKSMSVDIRRLVEKAKDTVLGSKSHSIRTSSVTTSFPKPKSVSTKKKNQDDAHLKEVDKPCIESTGTSEINEIKIQQNVITEVNLDTVVEVKVEQFSDGEPANIDINAHSVNVNYDMGEDCNEVKNEVQECQNVRRSSRKIKNKYIGYSTEGMERKDSGDDSDEEYLEYIDAVDEATEMEEMLDGSSTDDGSIKRKCSRKGKARQLKKQRKWGKERSEKMYDSDEEDIYVQSVDVNEEQNSDIKQNKTQTYEIGETSADKKVWMDIAVMCTTGDCGEVVFGLKNLAEHKLNKHEEQLRYNCSACDEGKSNKGFLKRGYLKDHFLISHSYLNCVKLSFKDAEITDSTPDVYHCTKCLFMTQDQSFPIDHNCSRVGLKYFCPYCVKNTFESYTKCESHLKSHHADKIDCASKDNNKGLKTTMYDPALSVQEGETECVACKTICTDTEQLKIHVNDKHATHPYCCGLCRLACVRPATLNRHMKSHNTPLQCTQCDTRFSRNTNLQRHIARYKDQKKIPCDSCSRKFCDKLALRRHRETGHGVSTTKRTIQVKSDSCICEHCGLLCPDPTKLQTHLLSHKRPPLETCKHCFQSLRKTHLATHKCVKLKRDTQENVVVPTDLAAKKAFYQTHIVKTTSADNGKNIMCTLCQKQFATKKLAKNHLRRMHCHDDQKGSICNICHKGFTDGKSLTVHMRYHSDSRPYRCRICNMSFRQLGHVKEHLRSHGKMLIVCHYCPLKFKTRRSLMRHIEIHCQVFPYVCMMKTCERAFKSIELMTAHLKKCLRLTSDGNVDIVCKLCNVSFSHSKESLTHVVKHYTDDFLFYKCERCSLKFGTYQKLYVHMEENDHFNNLPAVANQKSGENCVPGTANEGESTEQQAIRYFKMEEVDLDIADILNMYDYIPDEDAPVQVGTVKGGEAETELGIVNGYFEEVTEETNHTKHVENVAGASNLMQFAEQLTSITSGDSIGCKRPEKAGNYMASAKGMTQVSDGKKWSNLNKSRQNSAYPVAKLTVPDKLSETEYVIDNSDTLSIELNATDVTQLLTKPLGLHNNSALQRERSLLNPVHEEVISGKSHKKHVTRKLVDSLGNEVCLINDQGMPINVNDLGDTDALDLGFTIVEMTDDEIEDKGATSACQKQLSEGVKGDRKFIWDSLSSDVQEVYKNPDTTVHDVETVNYKISLNNYENRNDELLPYKCEVCGKHFRRVKYLNQHKKIHLPSSQRKFICQVCGLGFTSGGCLRTHKRTHTNERPYPCSKCDKSFRQIGHLQSHLRIHEGYKPFQCSHCGNKYTTNSQLKTHVMKHHRHEETNTGSFNNEQVACSSCGETFLDSGELTVHQLEHLSSLAQLELLSQFSLEEVKPSSRNNSSTEKVKQSAQKLNAKQKTDKSQDTFFAVCDTCGDVFRSKVGFRIHSRRHKVEAGEMYQCQHCPNSIWETQEQLDKHVATRHRDSIQCDQCGLQVENAAKLRRHKMKEHTGREIKCSRCQHLFVSSSGFVTHVKNCFGQQFLSKLQEASK